MKPDASKGPNSSKESSATDPLFKTDCYVEAENQQILSNMKVLALVISFLALILIWRKADAASTWFAELPWYVEGPIIVATLLWGYSLSAMFIAWLHRLATQGGFVQDLCKPVFVWVFFGMSIAVGLYQLAFTMNEMIEYEYAFAWVVGLHVQAGIALIGIVGTYGWLRAKPIWQWWIWKLSAQVCVAALASMLIALPAILAGLMQSPASSGGELLLGVISFFPTICASYLYAYGSAFRFEWARRSRNSVYVMGDSVSPTPRLYPRAGTPDFLVR